MLTRLGADELGAAAIEYGLLAGMVAAALVAVLLALGQGIGNVLHQAEPTTPHRVEVPA